MSDELKPCPHCKNARNIKLVEYRPNCSGAVVCGQCGARGPKAKNDHKRSWKEKAIEGWNTRAERTCHMTMCDDDGDLPAYYRAYRCDACGEVHNRNKYDYFNFCPNCGAKVVG
nr:MAG TPA: restriction alleviation protein [Caudoviricetes sp.]